MKFNLYIRRNILYIFLYRGTRFEIEESLFIVRSCANVYSKTDDGITYATTTTSLASVRYSQRGAKKGVVLLNGIHLDVCIN